MERPLLCGEIPPDQTTIDGVVDPDTSPGFDGCPRVVETQNRAERVAVAVRVPRARTGERHRRLRRSRPNLVLQPLRQPFRLDAGASQRFCQRVGRRTRKRHAVRAPQLRDPREGIAWIEAGKGDACREEPGIEQHDGLPQVHPLAIPLKGAVHADATVRVRGDGQVEVPRQTVVPDERVGLRHPAFEREVETTGVDQSREQPRRR